MDDSVAGALRPATVLLYEWTDYWATCPGATALTVGGTPAPSLPGGVFQVRFENRLGRAMLQARDDTGPIGKALCAEVISRKFASPADYVRFTRALLDDLFARSLRLPFAVDAPTARAVAEARQPPTSLFLLHFLATCGDDLDVALRMILRHPHQDVTRRAEWVDVARAAEADADVLLDVATAPDRWVRAPRPELPIARRLGGHVPRELRQPLTEVTFDTAENRFVRAFLATLVRGTEDLPRGPLWPRVPEHRRQDIARLGRACRRALAHPIFTDVRPSAQLPASSRVLMRREGYRELYDLWRRFHSARRPLFAALAEAIDQRDMALLYEVWAFYALVEEIGTALGQAPELSARVTDVEGLAWRARARFGGRGQLVYNHTVPSYSTPLRPDYLWLGGDGTRVAFDAKFRLGNLGSYAVEAADSEADRPTDSDGTEWLAAAVDERGLRYPAIGTMHHYRDALGLAAAIVVYPGRRSAFYTHPSTGAGAVTLDRILVGGFQGVGAIGMTPVPAATTV